MKYANKTEDVLAEVLNTGTQKYVELENLTTIVVPELTPKIEEISGCSGMLGAIEIPDWTNLEALEVALKFTGFPDNDKYLLMPTGTSLKANWAESYANEHGMLEYDSYAMYASGISKNTPGGERKKGDKSESEYKIACRYYKLIKNGTTTIEYDPLNGKICFHGVNYAEKLKSAMTKY